MAPCGPSYVKKYCWCVNGVKKKRTRTFVQPNNSFSKDLMFSRSKQTTSVTKIDHETLEVTTSNCNGVKICSKCNAFFAHDVPGFNFASLECIAVDYEMAVRGALEKIFGEDFVSRVIQGCAVSFSFEGRPLWRERKD
jgi:hypothetical protein